MSETGVAATPAPPYYAVIFTSTRTAVDEGYGDTAARMVELAAQQPGFLGVESDRKWYAHFETRLAKVERAYGGPRRA